MEKDLEACIRLLGLNKKRENVNELSRGVITYETFYHLYRKFGKSFLLAFKNIDKKNSSRIVIYDREKGLRLSLSTYLGTHAEYIVIPDAPYCGCMSRYPTAIIRREICPHIVGFCLDYILKEVTEIYFEEESLEILTRIYKAMLE